MMAMLPLVVLGLTQAATVKLPMMVCGKLTVNLSSTPSKLAALPLTPSVLPGHCGPVQVAVRAGRLPEKSAYVVVPAASSRLKP